MELQCYTACCRDPSTQMIGRLEVPPGVMMQSGTSVLVIACETLMVSILTCVKDDGVERWGKAFPRPCTRRKLLRTPL